jgi:uncharacterized membrane protein (TIGR01666 family)
MITITNYIYNKQWYHSLQKAFWRNPNRLLATKVVTSIGILSLPFVLFGYPLAAVTLSLGSLAAALAETDDHPRGRLKALFATIISFAITTTSVALLKPFPILFGIGFITSTIVFVLIGGINERYRGISYGAILVGIYAMLGYKSELPWYWLPSLLCAGALFYGIISTSLLYHKPWRLLEEQLSRGFITLSNYLEEKADHFPGYNEDDARIGNKLAILNIQVVSALEKCKEVLNSYGQEVKNQKLLLPYLQRFMLLQSLHERAASSHERYEKLRQKTEYQDLLGGFSELLHQLSLAARLLAKSMLTGQSYKHPVSIGWIVSALEFEIEKIQEQDRQLLELLLHNLSRSHRSLENLNNPEESTSIPRLGQDNRTTWQRIKDQLKWSHPRLRYAIRLSSCFLIGYLIVHFFQLEKGEWIMMTSLFVSQPTYSETRRRLFQRILGTLTGVFAGVSLLQLLPTDGGQLILILLSAYFFFYYLHSNYSYAVVFISIFVLAGNHLTRDAEFEILLPRILDTSGGALLAFMAIRFLWPNWQHKRLPQLIAQSLENNAHYFNQILKVYRLGYTQEDDYEYRLARRLAHKSDNALTLSWQSMQVEPSKQKQLMQKAFTLTYLNHALLSHLSALGAQREELSTELDDTEHMTTQIENALFLAAKRIQNETLRENEIQLKPLLIELKNLVKQQKYTKKRQEIRLLYNIAAVSNKLLKESELF